MKGNTTSVSLAGLKVVGVAFGAAAATVGLEVAGDALVAAATACEPAAGESCRSASRRQPISATASTSTTVITAFNLRPMLRAACSGRALGESRFGPKRTF
ncbi:MAG: hypothetical protein KGK35_03980 [Xanthomonadaceae bacterium]|nr:hypothetical protein [Xanthomonadaceae bacterium]MDE2224900.1 hypothetical protein [Xanthomonadaceae bacterium]MDE2496964.1 hypothetical protein [Xanthomonadaceae bacterium]